MQPALPTHIARFRFAANATEPNGSRAGGTPWNAMHRRFPLNTRNRARAAALLGLLLVAVTISMTKPPAISQAAGATQFPIRAAFYYGWFPEAWNQSNIFPFTKYSPSLGWYDSGDEATARVQIDAMKYGNIHAGIATWWGRDTTPTRT
jgi:hypothetical protein